MTGDVDEDSLLVREREYCLVEAFVVADSVGSCQRRFVLVVRLSGSEVLVLLRV